MQERERNGLGDTNDLECWRAVLTCPGPLATLVDGFALNKKTPPAFSSRFCPFGAFPDGADGSLWQGRFVAPTWRTCLSPTLAA